MFLYNGPMIINRYELDDNRPDLQKLKKGALIFDIETTGFSAKYNYIYLIGMSYYDQTKETWVLEQWFREKDSDEYEMLFRFNEKLITYSTLYHFNGDNFDIPFIKKKDGPL